MLRPRDKADEGDACSPYKTDEALQSQQQRKKEGRPVPGIPAVHAMILPPQVRKYSSAFTFVLLTALCLGACVSRNPGPGSRAPEQPAAEPKPPRPVPSFTGSQPDGRPLPFSPYDQSSRVLLPARVQRITSRGIDLTFILFDARNYRLSVADKEKGPKTEWPTAQAAAKAHGALAAINGGFFTPEGKPLGLVIENGRHIGTWNAGSSLTSGVLSVEKSPRILRRRHWRSFSPTLHLVQAGPLLVENDIVVNGLGNRERSPRSFLAWNGRHHWALGSSGKATLSELARALAAQPLAKLNITTALNLDGGRSSDLWVSPQVAGGPVSTRKSWNNPVRNYLLLHYHPQP